MNIFSPCFLKVKKTCVVESNEKMFRIYYAILHNEFALAWRLNELKASFQTISFVVVKRDT